MFAGLDQFFLMGPPAAIPETGTYEWPLVILSYLVASLSSYTAIVIGQQVPETPGARNKFLLRMGGAFALGAGTWAMHFVGMLSYRMDMLIRYDPVLTILSMVIAVMLAYGVMGAVGRKNVTMRSLLMGALLLGLGICLMHFTGMAAMRMDGLLRYKPDLFVLSGIIALSMSAIALYLAFILIRGSNGRYAFWYRIAAGAILGAAICGMHYTAMMGAVFIPFADCRYDPSQSFAGIAITITLITAVIMLLSLFITRYRKKTIEGRLYDSEVRLHAIMDSTLDAMIGMDDRGMIIECNKQAEKLFGWSCEEIKGQSLASMMVTEGVLDMHIEGLRHYIKTGQRPVLDQRMEVVAVNKQGEEFPVELTVTFYKMGDEYYFTVFVRDVSEKKKGEKESALLSAIVASSDDPIISKTLNGIITSWNMAAERLFGYTAEEAVGCHISLIIPTERLDEEEHILSRIARGEKVEHFETVRRAKDGHDIHISLTVSPVLDADGTIIGASKLARDVTEKRITEQALEEATKRKDEFLTNMSHELRTPMNVVVGLSDILSRTEPLTDKQRHFISTLKSSADTLLALINDLLDFSKLEQDAVKLEIIDFNLLEVMAHVVSLMHVRAKEKNLELDLHYSPDVPYKLRGDPLRLQQILINIVSNAIKFTKEGKISVGISAQTDATSQKTDMVFVVADTGIGIAEEQRDIIFDKFSQADPSITRRYGGSGLGLSIVKTLIEKMNGQIKLESALGKGTQFTIHLPFALGATDKEKSVMSKPRAKKDPNSKARGKILFVEDYGPNTLVGTTFLDQFGYDYDIAVNGMQALERFRDDIYDVVLMDIQMPEMDGLEATRQIRAWEAEHGIKRTPIIAMTAHVLDDSRNTYKNVGMDDFIPKPFDAEELEHTLAKYCCK